MITRNDILFHEIWVRPLLFEVHEALVNWLDDGCGRVPTNKHSQVNVNADQAFLKETLHLHSVGISLIFIYLFH